MQRLKQLLVGTAISGVLIGGGTAVAMAQTSSDGSTPATTAPSDSSSNAPASTAPSSGPMAPGGGTNANCPGM
jgi:hypothetical protein